MKTKQTWLWVLMHAMHAVILTLSMGRLCSDPRKNSIHSDLSCTLCSSNLEMNQEHLEICEGTVHERRGLDMGTWRGLLDFWRRMIKKLEATVT